MKEKILQIALILTVLCQVRSENEYEIGSGTFVVSSSGKTRSGGVLAKENKTDIIVTVENTGDLVDGMINTNISNSKEIRSVFASMKKLNITFQCNIMDYAVFVVKFCQKQQEKKQEQEQEQNQQEESPKGTYNSTIQILQTTEFFGGVWTLRLSIFVKYKARLFTKKEYEACPRKQAIKSLKNLQSVNKTSTEISYKRSQAETAVKKGEEFEVHGSAEKKAKVQEHGKTTPDRPPKGVAKVMPFVRPIFIKITVKLTRKMKDLKEDESLYYTFFDFENQCVVIRAGRFMSVSEANNKTKVIVTGLNLTIEASSEKKGEHTFLIYDNRFKYVQVPRRDHMTKKANPLVAVYGCDAFNKVTMEKEANGTLFTFDILEKQRSQERNLDKILVYVSNEKKKEEHSVTPPALISKEKVSLSGYFHIKTGASNTIRGNKVDIAEKVRKIESCDLCPAVIENWLLMDGLEESALMNKIAAHHEQGVKPKKSSNLVTCGTVTFEVSSKDKSEPNGSIPKNVFVLYMHSKKTLNEDGKQIGKEQDSEAKQKERYTLPDEENAKHAMKIIELLQPAFDKNVQDAVAGIKKSISAKYGKDIWDTAEYISELKIARTAACTDSCQGAIKAVLQYKLTRKPKPVVLQPKVNFKMLLRFHFFAKFMKPQTLPTALMKRLYSPKYRSQKMPMIKQTPSPMHATKNKPPTKAVPESPVQKLRFEAAKGKRNPFSVLFPKLDQHREFLDYEQKMEKNSQQENNPLRQTPDFQVSNIKKQQYRDGEIIYDKKQQREALKRVEEDKPANKSNSGYALSVGKSIIIALVNCVFLFKL